MKSATWDFGINSLLVIVEQVLQKYMVIWDFDPEEWVIKILGPGAAASSIEGTLKIILTVF